LIPDEQVVSGLQLSVDELIQRDRAVHDIHLGTMRGASVTSHAVWCHTELGVLGGYWPVRDGDRLLQVWDRRGSSSSCPILCWSFTASAGGVSLEG
jgi:hypothetical protein